MDTVNDYTEDEFKIIAKLLKHHIGGKDITKLYRKILEEWTPKTWTLLVITVGLENDYHSYKNAHCKSKGKYPNGYTIVYDENENEIERFSDFCVTYTDIIRGDDID